jgi:N-acetylmuramoyl-L-alanine amidase
MRPGEEKIVVLDPGHGGKDPGAVGPTGLRESDVVLTVAGWCSAHLKRMGVKVYFTREIDEFITLEDRAKFANEKRADAFLSIHCNSAKNPAQGIETFIARRTAVSYPLAESVQESLTGHFHSTPDRGVKRANFTVLTRTAMAAALAELEFIHTRKGEKILRKSENLERYGKALALGVAQFLGVTDWAFVNADPEEPEACSACEEKQEFKAMTPGDFVEVGARLSMLETRVERLEGPGR